MRKYVVTSAGALAAVVLLVAGFVVKDAIRAEYLLLQLRSATTPEGAESAARELANLQPLKALSFALSEVARSVSESDLGQQDRIAYVRAFSVFCGLGGVLGYRWLRDTCCTIFHDNREQPDIRLSAMIFAGWEAVDSIPKEKQVLGVNEIAVLVGWLHAKAPGIRRLAAWAPVGSYYYELCNPVPEDLILALRDAAAQDVDVVVRSTAANTLREIELPLDQDIQSMPRH